MKHLILIIVFLGLVCLNACQDSNDLHITAEQFIIMKDTVSDAVMLDVRSEPEFKAGHLEGAQLISIGHPDFLDQIKKLDKDKTYFVYCQSGVRSRTAVNRMRGEGFKKAYNVRGGIRRLAAEGVPVVE